MMQLTQSEMKNILEHQKVMNEEFSKGVSLLEKIRKICNQDGNARDMILEIKELFKD